jgi:hypothetical protein
LTASQPLLASKVTARQFWIELGPDESPSVW